MSSPARTGPPSMQDALGRLSRADQIIGAASIVLLIFMFFDWVSASCSGNFCGSGGFSGFHGWGWLTFIAVLATIVFFVIRNFLRDSVEVPELPLPDWQIYTGLGVVEILGVFLFWIEYRDGFGSVSGPGFNFSIGLGFGWWVALIASALTIAGGYLKQQDEPAVAHPRVGSTPGGYGAPPPPPPAAPPPPPPAAGGYSAPPPPSAPSPPPPPSSPPPSQPPGA